MTAFDFRNPDYLPIYEARLRRLQWLRSNPDQVPAVLAHYRTHPWLLIDDWGMTSDTRNADIGLPVKVPFVLMPRQREWLEWAYGLWQNRKPGVTEKSRDCGVSWLSVALGATVCLTHANVNVGYGSRKEEYVDKAGAPKALFFKARQFLSLLPPELTSGWSEKRNAKHMLISFPTGSTMTGEAGDSIGRGDRAAMYFVDEAAFLERPQLAEGGLAATTNCRIDISSANGTDNPFYAKVKKYPPEQTFRFHWRDDPRKDQAWYEQQCLELDPVTVAQEIDINYSAAKTGIVIPPEWVRAAIDLDVLLGVEARGERKGALDVADEGHDLNAFAHARGVLVEAVEEWSGKGSDIFYTVEHAFELAEQAGMTSFRFDADGLGAGVRGDARVINATRKSNGVFSIEVEPFRGSGEVYKPEASIPSADPTLGNSRQRMDRKNGDYFHNAKAQGWWELRIRFQRAYRAREALKAGLPCPYELDDMIVLRSTMKNLSRLEDELSQPTYDKTTAGKILIDKAPKLPDGRTAKSPNLADSLMILFAPRKRSFLASI